jgi:hypothetical protein
MISENKVLGGKFGHQKENVIGPWRKYLFQDFVI